MNRVSDRFLQLGVVAALIGMTMGVVMGAREDFTLAPAHAHLNLLGWVSMVLYGLFYRAFPQATEGKLPAAHFTVNVLGVAVLIPSLALMLLQIQTAITTKLTAASSVLVLLSMVLFAVIVFKATNGQAAAAKTAKAA